MNTYVTCFVKIILNINFSMVSRKRNSLVTEIGEITKQTGYYFSVNHKRVFCRNAKHFF